MWILFTICDWREARGLACSRFCEANDWITCLVLKIIAVWCLPFESKILIFEHALIVGKKTLVSPYKRSHLATTKFLYRCRELCCKIHSLWQKEGKTYWKQKEGHWNSFTFDNYLEITYRPRSKAACKFPFTVSHNIKILIGIVILHTVLMYITNKQKHPLTKHHVPQKSRIFLYRSFVKAIHQRIDGLSIEEYMNYNSICLLEHQ